MQSGKRLPSMVLFHIIPFFTLIAAARNNHPAVVSLLLANKGVDPQTKDSNGRSARTVAHADVKNLLPPVPSIFFTTSINSFQAPKREGPSYRDRILNEILQTEQDYLSDLDLLCVRLPSISLTQLHWDQSWREELLQYGTVTEEEINTLFANVKEIKVFNKTEVLDPLEKLVEEVEADPDRERDSVEIGGVFVNLVCLLHVPLFDEFF